MKKKKIDNINHPAHYTKGIETIEYIRSWEMDYVRGNIIKYVTRAPYKHDNPLQDLEKAKFYLEYLIKQTKE
jgi:aryl-phospho-beta-D-glucosidase BglC (GH1 family)